MLRKGLDHAQHLLCNHLNPKELSWRRGWRVATVLVMSLFLTGAAAAAANSAAGGALPPPDTKAATNRIAAQYGKIPLSFEANQGQTDSNVQFLSHGSGYSLFLTKSGVVLNLERPKSASKSPSPGGQPEGARVDILRMKLLGANANAAVAGVDPQPGQVSYLIGNDPKKWRSGVPTFGKVTYSQVYPGVDLVFYGNQRQLEYDFVVAPGADPSQIAWQIEGASPTIDKEGNLVLTAVDGPASFEKPILYQKDGDKKISVNGWFVATDDQIRFHLGEYDHARPLFIDPVLSYASYLGGTSTDNIGNFIGPGHTSPTQGIAVDAQGSVYVTGYTYSTDFPTQNPYQSTPPAKMSGISPGQWTSAFVTKFSPDGSSLIYSTYLGGNGYDYGYAIAVDSNGNAYITGSTTSPDFPVTSGAYQTVCSPTPSNLGPPYGPGCNSFYQSSAFVTKLNATGTGLVYSTFLGGYGSAGAVAIAVDSAGRAYIAGNEEEYCSTSYAFQSCFPTTTGAVINGSDTGGYSQQYGFVAAFDPTGAKLLYSTMFGDLNGLGPNAGLGSGTTYASGVAVDANGNFYLVGHTEAADLPTTAGVIQPTQGPVYNGRSLYAWRGFVAKFNPVIASGGPSLAYATYLGGQALTSISNISDFVSGVATDSAGNVYVAGYTQSPNYPVTTGAYQTTCGYGGGQACATAYVTKLNSTLSAIEWATYLGNTNGSSNDNVGTVGPMQVDGDGNVYLTGQAWFGFPVLNPVEPSAVGGSLPTFVAELDPNGQKLLFATQINSELNSIGISTDSPAGLAVDTTGIIYVAGNTVGPGLLVTPGAFMTTENDFGGQCCALGNGFVAKIGTHGTATIAFTALPSPSPAGQTVTLKATVTPTQQYASVPTGTVAFDDGTTVLGMGTLDASGVATFSTSTLPPNTYSMNAVYSGDSTYSIVSANQALTITPTDTAPGISPNPAAFGNKTMNTSAQIPVTVTNTGASPLVIYSITPSSSADFSQANNCTGTLAVNAGCTVTITFNPTSATTESAMFMISDNAGIQTLQATGTGLSPVSAQTITFGPLANVQYGVGPIALTATASSGLPVTYAVSGPAALSGSTLTITGAGLVTVTASQAGNASYSAATPVSQGFTVGQAVLTVTANSASRQYGAANPAFTYAITGFVNGDSSSVVSGTATETTTATATSATGSYPITFVTENLVAANYRFNYVSGTLTVSGGVSQTITFNPLANVLFGVGPITLTATASSTLPVTYAATGPALVSGSTLTITGAGLVTVTASQPGNANYAAAPSVSQGFTVNKAVLTVTASNASRPYGAANPAFTYAITGFVNGNTSSVVSGTATETTTATATSAPGSYPITFSTESLVAANYTFNYVSGTLTVSGGVSQTLTFNPLPNVTLGVGPITLTATASSGLPVSYAVSGPATLSGSTLTITGTGLVTVTASQAGNAGYAAATPVAQSFTVLAATTGNFTITPIPPAEFDRGVIGVFILKLTSTSGFKGNVTLSCSGLPTGTRCLDFPQTVGVNGTAYAISEILFPANTAPGTYTVTFTGVSGTLTNTATAKLTVRNRR